MATVTLTYVIHNVPAGKCTSVFTAQDANGDAIAPINTVVNVSSSFFAPVVVDPPSVVVSS